MKYALLRGLLLGAAGAAGGFLIAEALLRVVMFLDGSVRMESDDEFHPSFAAFLGVICACIGYATHPLAKGLPKPMQEKLAKWAERYAPRFLFGSLVGTGVAIAVAVGGALGCKLLGVLPSGPRDWRWHSWEEKQHLAFFVVAGMSAAAFAASAVGALLAPSAYSVNELRPLARYCAWMATLGAIAGAWIGAGAGLVVVNVGKWKWEYQPSEDVENWLAIGAGLVAGTAAAIMLRVWRKQ